MREQRDTQCKYVAECRQTVVTFETESFEQVRIEVVYDVTLFTEPQWFLGHPELNLLPLQQ